jgi:hypothetical protein
LDKLKEAQDLIETHMPPFPAFQDTHPGNLLYLDKTGFMGVYYTFFCEVIGSLISKTGFDFETFEEDPLRRNGFSKDNLITDKEIRIRTRLSKEMELFLTKLNLSH